MTKSHADFDGKLPKGCLDYAPGTIVLPQKIMARRIGGPSYELW
jgi:hypothetical protein